MADQTFKPGDKALWKGGSYLVEVVSGPYECGGVEMYVYRLRSGNHGFGELEAPSTGRYAERVARVVYSTVTGGAPWEHCQNKPMYREWATAVLDAVLPRVVRDRDGDKWERQCGEMYSTGGIARPYSYVVDNFWPLKVVEYE